MSGGLVIVLENEAALINTNAYNSINSIFEDEQIDFRLQTSSEFFDSIIENAIHNSNQSQTLNVCIMTPDIFETFNMMKQCSYSFTNVEFDNDADDIKSLIERHSDFIKAGLYERNSAMFDEDYCDAYTMEEYARIIEILEETNYPFELKPSYVNIVNTIVRNKLDSILDSCESALYDCTKEYVHNVVTATEESIQEHVNDYVQQVLNAIAEEHEEEEEFIIDDEDGNEESDENINADGNEDGNENINADGNEESDENINADGNDVKFGPEQLLVEEQSSTSQSEEETTSDLSYPEDETSTEQNSSAEQDSQSEQNSSTKSSTCALYSEDETLPDAYIDEYDFMH